MELADKVARFYVQHDRSQLLCLDNEGWNKILSNSSAWQQETKLPVSHAASASSRLMHRRRQRGLAGAVVADSSAAMGARALAQLMQGFTVAASWLISPQSQVRIVEMGKVAARSLFALPLGAVLGHSRVPGWLALDKNETPSAAKPLLPHTQSVGESADSEAPPTTPPRQETKTSAKRSASLRLSTPPAPPMMLNASPIMLNARH